MPVYNTAAAMPTAPPISAAISPAYLAVGAAMPEELVCRPGAPRLEDGAAEAELVMVTSPPTCAKEVMVDCWPLGSWIVSTTSWLTAPPVGV